MKTRKKKKNFYGLLPITQSQPTQTNWTFETFYSKNSEQLNC
jgi:hypothetical protein